jgi:polyisoprenoid-binding protein YceI
VNRSPRFLPILHLAFLPFITACSASQPTATPVIAAPPASTSLTTTAPQTISATTPTPLQTAPAAATPTAPMPPTALPPSGVYQLDPAHASVTFKINHLGFSHYTGRFDKIEGVLSLNAASPAESSLEATVDTSSIDTNNPKLEEDLRGDKWFNVIAFPHATFVSRDIKMTGPTTAKVAGDFTLRGQTNSLTLDASLVGQGTNVMIGKPVVGFSAVGSFSRSDYGLSNLLPLVGDDVTLEIEAEFDKAE